jgi:hypothetical protein
MTVNGSLFFATVSKEIVLRFDIYQGTLSPLASSICNIQTESSSDTT